MQLTLDVVNWGGLLLLRFKGSQLLLMCVFKRGKLNLKLELVLLRSLVLLSQRFVDRLGLFQVADQLLYFERGEDDEVADAGHLKRCLVHRHALRRQCQPIYDLLERRLHEEADQVTKVLPHDGYFVAGAEERRRGFLLLLSVGTLAGRLRGNLELLWRAATRAERRLLDRVRGRPEVSLVLVKSRRGRYRSV